MIKRLVLFFVLTLLIGTTVFAVPTKMNFQGRLTDSGGNPIVTAVEVKFSIFDASSGGTELWTETIAGLTPDQGLINQELGLATPITSGIFSGDTRYLAIKVGADAEMTPRIPLATVPFAFRAAVADSIIAGQVVTTIASTGATPLRDAVTLSGGTGISLIQSGQDIQITAVSTAGGTVTQVDTGSGLTGGPINTTGTISIAAGGINATHLGTGVVTDGAIANNTITEPKIQAMNDPVNSYLLTYTATGLAWSPAGGTGTVTQVDTGSGLTGGPINTTGTVSIAAGGINATHLGTGAVTAGAIAGSAVITAGISDGAVTAAKIGSGQVVTSIASSGAAQLKDDVTFSSGTGISLNQVGQNIQITAVSTAGGTVTQVNTQAPVLGGPITTTGTISMPAASGAADGYLTSGDWTTFNNKLDSADLSGYVQLGPTIGQTTTAAYAIQVKTTHASGVGISGETTASSGSGVYGANSSATGGTGGYFEADGDTGTGVYGYGKSAAAGKNFGVYGRTDSANGYGVFGYGASEGYGVYGYVNAMSMTSIALCGETSGPDGYALVTRNGAVSFETASLDINNVHYTWPSANPGSSTVLTNDGSGFLSWEPSGGADLSGYVQLGPTTQQSTTAAYAIRVKTTNVSGVGISGEATVNGGVGIYGLSSYNAGGAGNLGYGVVGVANSYGGHGVHGIAYAGDGSDNVGVYGFATGNQGVGVSGKSVIGPSGSLGTNNYGVSGAYDATNSGYIGGNGTGVYGEGATYAVYGNSNGGTGVYGYSPNGTGVYGISNNAAGYALRGYQQNASGYSVHATGGRNYFQGKTGIGTDNPGEKLSVAGTIEITSGSSGGLKFPDGTIQTTAATGGSTPDLSGYVQFGPTTQQSTTAAYAINVKSTHASGVGISAEVNAATGRAISGINSYSTGGMGGYFRSGQISDGSLAVGVRGEIPGGTTYGELVHYISIMDSGTTKTGVYGYTSDSGSGVYGNGDSVGVRGDARSDSGRGVYGVATSATGMTKGGYFIAASDTGYAVHAVAQHAAGVNYALFGETNSAAGYALYSQGGMNCLWGNTGIGTDNPQALLHVAGDCIVDGTLSKGGGSFDIVHPDPAKASQGYRLRHSFVESPTRGDNLYRWVATVEGGGAKIVLPDYFKYLNENVQVWVSPKKHFGQAYGEANEALTEIGIRANADGEYNVLAVATRKDKLVKDWFDSKGVEYIKTEVDPLPSPEIE
ncbi:hypothetical protein A3K48_07975 [candidate division WOR-1 bacterium RIFOXYA12_FULL_52_29]|uniref:Peptidase S74 domain-containing protein n=1 Tax=candidate division WOR-1 bacterium RIFOXYC12_FULL_54_18 TaxID=1802584 RepID=A0A1F4T826_UNCSA|nr:MAG: hypothetical protein A3K44_07975 [candidate division WOR-1 bacterium RIFOXYA2_FULL_51_19]OGC18448.1 MAG: hypothetical protein A3K48_07975 [candidate division WOR-1 bacterium RIFOXYA12_FULL_52_29]OGC27302.1 MAG: hypothetical protein A3K32_07970 [candidate division WOR-1 bacterium RIFOXYB2_FULL_45_9]OGC28865.1 MAG: hypothetical protein A3K49_07975 [candidate division WOR-1 bacterium RIFOXYC12_FULL_54_18]